MKLKNLLKLIICIGIFILSLLLIAHNMVIFTSEQIISLEEAKRLASVDCILILGAGINGDKPSKMLEERLDMGINVYNLGITNKIIATGDHVKSNHDEVNVMKKYLIDAGIKSENIFMDHAGISTYDSIYRAKEIFDIKKIVIISQGYHLPRALYIAKKLGIEAYGVNATKTRYQGQTKRDIREVLARIEDFFKVSIKPTSTYLGHKISLNNGNYTNDNYALFIDEKEKYLYHKNEIDKIQNIIDAYEFRECDCLEASKTLNLNNNSYKVEIKKDSFNIQKYEDNVLKEISLNESDIIKLKEILLID